MRNRIEVGQLYEHESGEVYEALNVSDTGVEFDSSEGVFIRMSRDDAEDDIRTGVLTLLDDGEEEDDDADE